MTNTPAQNTVTAVDSSSKVDVGRLKMVGITEPWRAVMLLPKGWDDFSSPIFHFSSQVQTNERHVFCGYLASMEPRFGNGPPRLLGALKDEQGNTIRFSAIGDTRDLQDAIIQSSRSVEHGGLVTLYGKVASFNGVLWLNEVEHVHPLWRGRIRPQYSGIPRKVSPQSIRDSLPALIRTGIDQAVSAVCSELDKSDDEICRWIGLIKDGRPVGLRKLLISAHYPSSRRQGIYCVQRLELLAALRAVHQSRQEMDNEVRSRIPGKVPDWRYFADSLPFTMSDDQSKAADEIVADLNATLPMRRILSGDVGYGKSAVFCVAAAAVHATGGRLAILLPNESLAEQCFSDILTYWPHLESSMQLVTGSTRNEEPVTEVTWFVGTTALLFKQLEPLDLVIVDEQQKFSREQREHLLSEGTHLLEATATCIPRSQALVQYGRLRQSILSEPPVEKHIHTVLRAPNEQASIFADAKETLADGGQILVVYPRREGTKSGGSAPETETRRSDAQPLDNVETAAKRWAKHYPGLVRTAHGAMDDAHNEEALKDMRENRASILLATTVVEVGLNIPNLRRVIIVQPDRYGLSALHQIRGRAARHGGIGYCDLYLTGPVKEKTMARLRILENCQNGFEIAMEDLKIRGFGSLASNSDSQAGADNSFLIGRPLTPEMMERALDLYGEMYDCSS